MTRAEQKRSSLAVFRPATTIVVPVLNEADNVLALVKRIKKAVTHCKVEVFFIVDDIDKHKMAEQVKLVKAKYRSNTFDIRAYYRQDEKRWGGLSGAVIDGITQARCDQIIVMDGDLQHPPETIPDLITVSTRDDIAIASRYCKGGSANGLNGGVRHIVSRGSTLLAKAFFPRRLHTVSDPMTGFFLINRTKFDTSKLHPKGFKILLEILVMYPQLTVTEIPLQFADRAAGESHGTLGRGIEFFSQLVGLRLNQLKRALGRLPKIVQFGAIGGSVFGLGMVLLYLLVEVLGWPPLQANGVQLVVTFWLNYVLNSKLTWSERTVSRLAAHKFLASRAATTVLNYLLFAWLISQSYTFAIIDRTINFSINYLVANIITLVAITVLNFIISDRWAFAESKLETDPAKAPYRPSNRPRFHMYLFILLIGVIDFGLGFNPIQTLYFLMTLASLLLFVQSSIEIWRIIYTYREPDGIDRLRFPVPRSAREKFCIIVPARHESAVLDSTLRQLAKQTHPSVSIITIICDDDVETLRVAFDVSRNEPRVKVMTFPLQPDALPNKPSQLNYVLNQIKGHGFSIIGVFDAEDTVHPELLKHIDTAFLDPNIGVVQGGVQLMNHDSSWYSLHNVLEYYRWFSSALAFHADNNFTPLSGNTVFIREKLLRQAGGWPETLTEDCALGVLLSTNHRAKTAVYYEPRLATREETPDSLRSLFKQRVRWNQGFFHEWRKGIWQGLPHYRQRLLADYVLLSPILLAAINFLLPISLVAILLLDAPVGLVMLMYLPLVPATLHIILNLVLLRDFSQAFQRKVRVRHYFTLIATQFVYQILLNTAALWAIFRELRGDYSWHKTSHTGQHRAEPAYVMAAEVSPVHFAEEDHNVQQ